MLLHCLPPRYGLWFACACVAYQAQLAAGATLRLEVRETAGIRRYSYPVSAELRLDPPAAPGARFRLLQGGKPVSAQLRTLEELDGRAVRLALDFEASFLPLEARRYDLEHGPDVPAGTEPAAGLELEERPDAFAIRNGSHIAYEVPRDLSELLRSVRVPRGQLLAPGGPGLLLASREGGGRLEPLRGDLQGRAMRKGPLAVALRWEGIAALGDARLPVTVDLEVPRSKSWVRVRYRIEDPGRLASRLGGAVRLRLERGEAFADFGAASFVYAAIPAGQSIELRAGPPAGGAQEEPPWEVRRGLPAALEPYVAALPGQRAGSVEGWAHLMDRSSAAAVAVLAFGERTRDRILLDATGRIEVSRELAADAGVRELSFALHLVDSPPHVGAVTSPQSMAAPLLVTLLDEAR